MTLAHLALGTARTDAERLRWKRHLAEGLYERGYGDEDIIELYRFLDWLVVLPPRLQGEYERHVDQLERKDAMPFLSLREERAIRKGRRQGRGKGLEKGLEKGLQKGLQKGLEQGREEGLEKGLREAIGQGLELRFGEKGRKLASRVERIHGADALRRVLEAIFTAERIDEVRLLLE